MSGQSYADFRAEQAARGRPVCDAFEPCKAAQAEPHPWSTAPEFTPCGRCGWSKRTHDPGIECGPIDPVRVPDREGATKLLQRIKDLQDDRARQHAEIERLRAQIETSATPADRAVGAAMLGSLR